jgi:hypothetical protein
MPSGAAHTVVRVINVIFDMRTSFFARCDDVIVTNPAVDFQVRCTENFPIAPEGRLPCAATNSTHDGRTTAGQHSVPGPYFPVSAGDGP